jgi:hypothetical protein
MALIARNVGNLVVWGTVTSDRTTVYDSASLSGRRDARRPDTHAQFGHAGRAGSSDLMPKRPAEPMSPPVSVNRR